MEGIDAVFYINLDKRADRRQEIESVLKEYTIRGERIQAIEKSPGIVGCGYSHLKALKLAKERGYTNVLILEDDFEFIVPLDTVKEEIRKLQTIKYDVVMISYNLLRHKDFNPFLYKVEEASTASGYIVHRRFYDKLIRLYEKYIPILERTHKWNLYANDQIWKLLQSTSAWYAFKTRIGRQRESFSDNTGKVENYGC
jgi:glycosyl transferase family 25